MTTALRQLVLALALVLGGPAAAQDDIRTVPVHFPAGTTGTTIKGTIRGYDSISYTVGAQAGQQMTLRLKPSNSSSYFNLYAPGRGPGDEALAVGEFQPEINAYSGVLPASGTYTVNVFLYRSAARRNEVSDFTLDVSVSALTDAAAPVQGDFADGLEGGPDFLVVQTSGGPVNMRVGPGGASPLVQQVANGTTLKNMGCRMNEGRRWCRVAMTDASAWEGWIAGDYLVEGAYAPPVPDPGDALVPGTEFNATGSMPCARYAGAPMVECDFGVKREGGGKGTVTVFWNDGGSRVIGYEDNRPIWFDSSEADGGATMQVREDNGLYVVTIGPQRFELFEAIMAGG